MRPAQVIPAVVMALGSFLWHPAAMHMMARKASWWGTKWFPLVPAAALYFFCMVSLPVGGLRSAAIAATVAIPLLVWFMVIVCTRWKQEPEDRPANQVNRQLKHHLLQPTLLICTSFCVYLGVYIGCIALWEEATRTQVTNYNAEYEATTFAIHKTTNRPAVLKLKKLYDSKIKGYQTAEVRAQYIEPGNSFESEGEVVSPADFRTISWISNNRSMSDTQWTGEFFSPALSLINWYPSRLSIFDGRGHVLVYDPNPEFHWSRTLSADGLHEAGDLSGRSFTADALSFGKTVLAFFERLQIATPLIDGNGIYAVVLDRNRFRTLLDQKITGAVMPPLEAGTSAKLLVWDERSVTIYEFVNVKVLAPTDDSHNDEPYLTINEGIDDPFAQIELSKLASIPLAPEIQKLTQAQIVHSDDNQLFLFTGFSDGQKLYTVHPDGEFDSLDFKLEQNGQIIRQTWFQEMVMAAGMPGVVLFAAIWFSDGPGGPDVGWLVKCWLVPLVLCVGFTWLSALRRRLSRRQTFLWCLGSIFLGFATPLAIISIYKRIYQTRCKSCSHPRRVDLEQCEHCGAEWASPEDQGIEIRDEISQALITA